MISLLAASLAICLLTLLGSVLTAQVSNERLLRAAEEPQNWLTYSGTYASQRYSTLKQLTPANVKTLEQKWIFQAESLEKFETTPLVVDGIMYITQAPSDALALDAKTGTRLWSFQTGAGHRGSAITYSIGGRQYVATPTGWGSSVGDFHPHLWTDTPTPRAGSALLVFALPEVRP